MSLLVPYLSAGGRAGRLNFWVGILSGLLILVALFLAIQFFGKPLAEIQTATGVHQRHGFTGWRALPFLAAALVALWLLLAANIRRLHDHNLSGWYLVGFVASMFVLLGLHQFTSKVGTEITVYRPLGDGLLSWIPIAFAFALWLFVFVKLSFLRGTVGPNRYGPDPLNPSATNA